MLVHELVTQPPTLSNNWHDRWEGPDAGLIVSWLRGLEKRQESPELAAAAQAGELPVLAWRGGVDKPIKRPKFGTLLYLATWQGLRGEDLHIDTEQDIVLTCTRHGVTVTYSANIPTEEDFAP